MTAMAARSFWLAGCLVTSSRALVEAFDDRLATCCLIETIVVQAAAAFAAHKVVRRRRASVFRGILRRETSSTPRVGGVTPTHLPRCQREIRQAADKDKRETRA